MTLTKYFSALTILGVLTLSVPAWADVAPDDQCGVHEVGQACDNATGNGTEFQPGVCKETMCSRHTPDGFMAYACYRCVPAEDGVGGQPNDAAGAAGETSGATSSAAGAPPDPPGGSSAGGWSAGPGTSTAGAKSGTSKTKSSSDDDGGCSISSVHGGAGGLGAVLVGLGFIVTGLRRRRSPVG